MKHIKLALGILACLFGNLSASIIHYAARLGSVTLVRDQLNEGISVNLPDMHRNTPLHYASSAKMAKFLLDTGADPNAKNDAGLTPLHLVPLKLSLKLSPKEKITGELAKTLTRGGANTNATDNGGNTPLHAAARFGRVNLIAWLLGNKANPNARNKEGITPLHAAVGLIQIGTAAIARNVTLGLSGPAVAGRRFWLYSNALAAQSQLAGRRAEGAYASAVGHARGTYQRAAQPAWFSHDPATAISGIMGGRGLGEVVKVEGEHYMGNPEAFKEFLAAKKAAKVAQVKLTKEADEAVKKSARITKLTPKIVLAVTIMAAAIILAIVTVDAIKRHRTVQKLIDGGANVNARDNLDNTPLHLMAAGRRFKLGERKLGIIAAHKLLDAGADYNAKNTAGLTPYQIARKSYRLVLAAVLKPKSAARREKRRRVNQ